MYCENKFTILFATIGFHDWNSYWTKTGYFNLKLLRPKRYLDVLLGESGGYKSKYTLTPLLSQKYSAFYFNNEVRIHRLASLVQMSWKVAFLFHVKGLSWIYGSKWLKLDVVADPSQCNFTTESVKIAITFEPIIQFLKPLRSRML